MIKPELHLEDQGSGSPGLVLVQSFACQRTRSDPARGSIERRINQEPYAIADCLWVACGSRTPSTQPRKNDGSQNRHGLYPLREFLTL
jgi:hypothetical protein